MQEVNLCKSLDKYKQRLLTEFTREQFVVFNQKFIGTYDVYSTFLTESVLTDSFDFEGPTKSSAFVLLDVLVNQHNINCLGITSMRKKRGQFIATLPHPYTENDIVYLGKHNYFTQLHSSEFRMKAKDIVRSI